MKWDWTSGIFLEDICIIYSICYVHIYWVNLALGFQVHTGIPWALFWYDTIMSMLSENIDITILTPLVFTGTCLNISY